MNNNKTDENIIKISNYDDDTKNIIIQGNEGYQKAKNFMKILMPKSVKKIKKILSQ